MTPARDREALDQAIVRGSELLKQGKLSEAQTAFRSALEIDGENVRVLALLGLSHFRAAEFDAARPIYEELVARAPTDAAHRLNLGLVYLKLNDADRAITSLEASRALDPSQGRAVSYLGLAYARAGRYAEAYRSFLLAGQNELAAEIEANLTNAERDGINAQLGRTPAPPAAAVPEPEPVIGRTPTPPSSPHAIARTTTPPRGVEGPRTPTPSHGVGPPPPPPARPTPPPVSEDAPQRPTPVPAEAAPQRPTPVPAEGAPQRAKPPPPPHSDKIRIPTIRPDEVDADVPLSITEPRTKPPSAPPKKRTGELPIPTGEFRVEFSQPEIKIERDDDAPARQTPPPGVPMEVPGFERASERQILAEIPVAKPGGPPAEPLRMTESMQFVLRAREQAAAAARPADGQSMVSMAITTAEPSPAVALRTPAGGTPPRPLSELATDGLIRPDEGGDPFEISAAGALVIRVTDRVMTRLAGVHVTGGDLAYEPAMRRSRGHQIEERFEAMHVVTGKGYVIAAPGKQQFHAVALDDDILYVREDLLFAFETSLRWENGNVPGLRGKLHVVQFRGDGALVMRLARPLVHVKLPPQGMVFVDAERLAGWIGRVIPRAVVPPTGGPMGAMCVECTGEGIVLVEPAPEPAQPVAADTAAAAEPAPDADAPEPPAPPREAELDLDGGLDGDDGRDEI